MSDRIPCIRCERLIDRYARSCVYCNWNQATPAPPETAAVPVSHPYVPPSDTRVRNGIIGAAAFVVLVIVAFTVGGIVGRSDSKPVQTAQAPLDEPASRSNITLVPVEGGSSVQSEPPVTSAPAQLPTAGNVEVNGDRADATALPSVAYSAAAQRATAERQVRTKGGTVDPRTITGAIEPRDRRTAPDAPPAQPPVRVASAHTQPVPLYQPVPAMNVDRPANARLFLTVDSDGRVRNINVAQSIPGEMPRLVASVQNWRFKPATENGQPVTSTFSVDINVHPR